MNLRAGVIGLGTMGRFHARSFQETDGVELVAVCDLDAVTAREAAGRLGLGPDATYLDAGRMVREARLDLVSVATPDHQHALPVIQAAEAGVHVLVEKPLATSLEDCDRVVAAVEGAGVIGMVNFTHRRALPYLYTKERIARDDFGPVSMVYARKNDTWTVIERWPWLADASSAAYLSSHDLDLACWWLDTTVEQVFARGVRGRLAELGHDTYDAIQASVRFASGAIGTFESCWVHPKSFPTPTDSYIALVAPGARITLDRSLEIVTVGTDDNYEHPKLTLNLEVDGRLTGAFVETVRHFVDCVARQRPPSITLASSRHVAAVADAIARSLASGLPEAVR
jgi:predicted dehydrogenase